MIFAERALLEPQLEAAKRGLFKLIKNKNYVGETPEETKSW